MLIVFVYHCFLCFTVARGGVSLDFYAARDNCRDLTRERPAVCVKVGIMALFALVGKRAYDGRWLTTA